MLITTSTKDRHKDLHNSFLEPKQSMTQNKRKNIQHQIIRNQPIFQTNKHQNNKAVHKKTCKRKTIGGLSVSKFVGGAGLHSVTYCPFGIPRTPTKDR
jgi:hypothetical protein